MGKVQPQINNTKQVKGTRTTVSEKDAYSVAYNM